MGKWFPGFRTGTPEQCKTFRDAKYDLDRNGRYEYPLLKQGFIREETERYLDLNDRTAAAAEPLSRTQQYWHAMRASDAEDRDFMRLQRESDRQERDHGGR